MKAVILTSMLSNKGKKKKKQKQKGSNPYSLRIVI